MQIRKTLPILMGVAMLLSACSTSRSAVPASVMMEQPTATMMNKPSQAMMDNSSEMMEIATPAALKQGGSKMLETATWFSPPLTDVSEDRPFSINDFKGKVVLVETMAQWCSTCLSQQKQVKELRMQLGRLDDFLVLGLDIDPNEDANNLKSYAAKNGFDWLYAVSTTEISREIGNLYGAQFLNPPSAPMLIIDRKGEVHILPFGVKSASDLLQALEPLLNQGM